MTQQAGNTLKTPTLALAALGIVFGDIGTSPLYALKACFSGFHAVPVNELNILGVLSLIFWSLTVVISLKYVSFIMRADNRGEGGIVALFSLLPEAWRKEKKWVVIAALFGASMLYGDGFITPAISVLSALEGLSVVTTEATRYVVPATCLVLMALFVVQRQGTHVIGRVFGPVMLLWFGSITLLGVSQIMHNPHILAALNPMHAARFFMLNGKESTIVLGAVVLCITGGEALYADMGHFGRKPIRLAWYAVAMPSLLINYFGQGALLLADHSAAAAPFYSLVPREILIPMVALSTCATIIASQAVISGVFSLTRQAIQLGYLPRTHILHTSEDAEGQIYCPVANWLMAIICVLLVVGFGSSDNLAGAYGIAITTTMCITTGLFFVYLRRVAQWTLLKAAPLCAFFMLFDLGFFVTNLSKLDGGGWIPISVAAFICLAMMIWAKGRAAVWQQLRTIHLPIEELPKWLTDQKIIRTPGTAVFLSASPLGIPTTMIHALTLTGTLNEQVVLFSIITEPVPRVESHERLIVKFLDNGIIRMIVRYGFAESPNVSLEIQKLGTMSHVIPTDDAVYYLGHEIVINKSRPRVWKSFYGFMSRNAMSPALYFMIPHRRVIEIGMHVEL